jgi:hypothetical protein
MALPGASVVLDCYGIHLERQHSLADLADGAVAIVLHPLVAVSITDVSYATGEAPIQVAELPDHLRRQGLGL